MNLSFAGCGFLGLYHVGVACAVKEYAPQLIENKIAGASAGSIAACALICGVELGAGTSNILKVVSQARQKMLGPLHPSFDLMRIVRDGLASTLPEDAYTICSGKLYISLTRFSDGKNVVVSEFASNAELIQAIICSAFIPFYCGTVPPTFRGVRYIDGGWSDNLPVIDENTVTVSPFSGESDICPPDPDSASYMSFQLCNTSIRFNSKNLYRFSVALFPPHPEILSEVCRQGFQDALRFLAKHNLITCARCIAIRSHIQLPAKSDFEAANGTTTEQRVSATAAFSASSTSSNASAAAAPQMRRRTGAGCSSNRSSAMLETLAEEMETTSAEVPVSVLPVSMHDNDAIAASSSHLGHHSHVHPCDECREVSNKAWYQDLPQSVKDLLRHNEMNESSALSLLYDFTIVKYARYLFLPIILPLDISYSICRRLLNWLWRVPSEGAWFMAQCQEAVAVIAEQVEAHRHRYSARFTCQLAITELNYSSGLTSFSRKVSSSGDELERGSLASFQAPPDLASLSSLRRAASATSLDSAASGTAQYSVKELSFGFSMDVATEQNRASLDKRPQMAGDYAVRRLTNLVDQEITQGGDISPRTVAQAASDLEWASLEEQRRRAVEARSPRNSFESAASFARNTGRRRSFGPGGRSDFVRTTFRQAHEQCTDDVHSEHHRPSPHVPYQPRSASPIRACENAGLDSAAELEVEPSPRELDTIEHIVDFTRQREALLTWYYLDSENKVRVTEIFGVGEEESLPQQGGMQQGAESRPRSWDGATAGCYASRDACTSPIHNLLED